jgi:PAS domain S-box-containing protein
MSDRGSVDYEEIFVHAPVGMCVLQHRMMHVANLALARMFGYTQAELAGQSVKLLYPSVDEFERTGARLVPLLNREGAYSDERIMRRAGGELFWCRVSGRSLVPADPHAAGIWTFEDISVKRPIASGLTPREREIAALMVEGKTSKLIARQLALSPRTVEMHRAKLMLKFSAATSSELIHKLLSAQGAGARPDEE